MGWFIFDLDGTLADMRHRLWLIDGPKKNYDGFYEQCHKDTPITDVINTFKNLNSLTLGQRCEIWTGRSEIVRVKTELWLEKEAGIKGSKLTRMRPVGDFTPDYILKKQWLDEALALGNPKPAGVFEDRQRVVDMWRENGITCYQVARGKF